MKGVSDVQKHKTSPRKIEANRQNARKSTGPRSSRGKARSSRNAVKHGLLAGRIVLADHPDEDPREFAALLDGLSDDYKPRGMIEKMMVERLAVSFWRLRRAYRFEAEAIAQANQPGIASQMLEQFGMPAGEQFEKVLPDVKDLDKLVRYESMIDRELLRTLAHLERRQRSRESERRSDDSSPAVKRTDPARPAKSPAPNEPTALPSPRATKAWAAHRASSGGPLDSGSRVQGSGSGVQGFRSSGIQGFRSLGVQEFAASGYRARRSGLECQDVRKREPPRAKVAGRPADLAMLKSS